MLVLFDQLTVSGHRVVPNIHADMTHDFYEIAKTLQSPRQKALPLGCLNRWISGRIKVDHGTLVAVIPIPEWDPRHQILLINEPHDLAAQQARIRIAEIIKPDSWLPKRVDRTDGPNSWCHDCSVAGYFRKRDTG